MGIALVTMALINTSSLYGVGALKYGSQGAVMYNTTGWPEWALKEMNRLAGISDPAEAAKQRAALARRVGGQSGDYNAQVAMQHYQSAQNQAQSFAQYQGQLQLAAQQLDRGGGVVGEFFRNFPKLQSPPAPETDEAWLRRRVRELCVAL